MTAIEPPARRGLRILCLDGGGMKGLFEIEMLKIIEQDINARLKTNMKIGDMFDLICGTSTGGLLAIALGLGKKTLAECEELYTAVGSRVFVPKSLQLFGKAKYSSSTLESVLKEQFQEARMDEPRNGPKVFVVATETSTTRFSPFLIRSYDDLHAMNNSAILRTMDFMQTCNGTSSATLWEACRATSAAPTYFSSFDLGRVSLVDGGLVANNPTEFAIFEAKRLWPDRSIDLILSIGSGMPSEGVGDLSLMKLLGSVVNLVTSSEDINRRVAQWLYVLEYKKLYKRFNPPGITDMSLDTVDPKYLQAGITCTQRYMSAPQQRKDLEEIIRLFEGHYKASVSRRNAPSPKSSFVASVPTRNSPGPSSIQVISRKEGPLMQSTFNVN